MKYNALFLGVMGFSAIISYGAYYIGWENVLVACMGVVGVYMLGYVLFVYEVN